MKKYIRVENGKLEIALENGYYEITIHNIRSERTLAQMKFYWSAIIPTIQEFFLSMGKTFTPAECHLRFKEIAGLYEEVLALDMQKANETGEITYIKIFKYQSFADGSKLTKKDFNNAYDRVNQALIEYSRGNIELPIPNIK